MRKPGKPGNKVKPGAKPPGARPEQAEPKRSPFIKGQLGQTGKRSKH